MDVLETARRRPRSPSTTAPAAAGYAADAVAADPLRESAAMVLAQALAAAGDRAGALAALDRLRVRLRDELGVDPSAAVTQLRQALLGGAGPSARVRECPAVPAARVDVRRPGVRRARPRARPGRAPPSPPARSWRSAGSPAPASPGWSAEATRGSAEPVLAGRAFLPERDEAWGLARSVLREALALDAHVADGLAPRVRAALAGLLPELDGPEWRWTARPAGRSCSPAGSVLAAAVGEGACSSSTTCSGPTPAAARSSRPPWPGCPGSRPSSPSGPRSPLPDALVAIRATRTVVDVALGSLPDDGLAALVPDPALAGALRAATDRTPFAVAEVLRELAARDVAVVGPDGRWRPRDEQAVALAGELGREGRRRVVQRRTDRETGVRATVLALVALLARETSARTVAVAAGLDPRATLDALSGLAAAGLVRLGEQGWATAHDLVGETVTAALPPGDRGRLHGLLAAALDADASSDPAEVARHHRDAGDRAAAATAFERAAVRALAAHATREAAAHAEAGLALDPAARSCGTRAPRPGRRTATSPARSPTCTSRWPVPSGRPGHGGSPARRC